MENHEINVYQITQNTNRASILPSPMPTSEGKSDLDFIQLESDFFHITFEHGVSKGRDHLNQFSSLDCR